MSTATRFALDLQSAFITNSAKSAFGEIAQFRALMDSFTSLKPNFPIEEFHGSRHQIYFNTSKAWLPRKIARCELCDLLVVSYSRSNGLQVKMTLLQAKLSHTRYPTIGAAGLKGVDHLIFPANFEQWDLLANRPLLIPTTVFAPPPTLLRDAVVPSIGSYGVFHKDSAGIVEFFYASADCITPVGKPASAKGRLETSSSSPRIRTVAGQVDVTYCSSVAMFAYSLFRLEIGTPVISTDHAGNVTRHAPLANWLRATLATAVTAATPGAALALELLSELPGQDQLGGNPGIQLPRVLVIRGESQPRDDA
jgi:hypothetical protein